MKTSDRSALDSVDCNLRSAFERDGFLIIPGMVAESVCDELAEELTLLFDVQREASRNRIGGVRNLLQTSPRVVEVANNPEIKSILKRELGIGAFPVRSIFFDKTPEANWSVAWHQDLHIAVTNKVETPGYGPWTVKAGVPHVQPPLSVLERMATIRLHLDDCDEANGALKVIPGSHVAGMLVDDGYEQWKSRTPVVCEIPKGGGLLMRPLLLHASSTATKPTHRRVLHLEYAAEELPNGLRWLERP